MKKAASLALVALLLVSTTPVNVLAQSTATKVGAKQVLKTVAKRPWFWIQVLDLLNSGVNYLEAQSLEKRRQEAERQLVSKYYPQLQEASSLEQIGQYARAERAFSRVLREAWREDQSSQYVQYMIRFCKDAQQRLGYSISQKGFFYSLSHVFGGDPDAVR